MPKLTRQHWIMLGLFGLIVCFVWFFLGALVLGSFDPQPAPTIASASNITPAPSIQPTQVASATRARAPEPTLVLPSIGTPIPISPAPTVARIAVAPTASIQRVVVSQQLVASVLTNPPSEGGFVSPDRRHVAHLFRDSKGQFITVDGKKIKTYDKIECCQIVWSPDSQHLAFIASQANKVMVVVDGKEGKLYDQIFALKFSPDSQHLIYGARTGAKSSIVLDGQEGKPYDQIDRQIIFSPNSKRIAYTAFFSSTTGAKIRVVVDGKEGSLYEGIISDTLRFSPDSQHVAYAAAIPAQRSYLDLPGLHPLAFQFQPTSRAVAVVDGREGKSYDGIVVGSMVYSPNSQRLAYFAKQGQMWFTIIDGKEDPDVTCLVTGHPLVFSPNSQRVAYLACDRRFWFAVVDGKQGKHYDQLEAHGIFFSTDSRRYAYGAIESSKWIPVVDGKEGRRYDGLTFNNPFSPDGQRVGYVADRNQANWVVVDDAEFGPYDHIVRNEIGFSPDGRHAAYILHSDQSERVGIDGTEGLSTQMILGDSGSIVFDAADSLRYLAVLPNAQPPGIYLIQEKIK
jgi:hypothetical protein